MKRRRERETCAHVIGRVLLLVTFLHSAVWAEPLEKTTRKGPVEAVVNLDPPDPKIGDSVTLTLTVVAEKDVEVLMPEFGQAMERFPILDFTTSEKIDGEGRTVLAQTYYLQPPRSGKQRIPSIMIEFVDRRSGKKPVPEGLDAYELLTESLFFEVQSVLPKDAQADLHPPLDALRPLAARSGAIWPWFVGALVAIVAVPFAWRWWSVWRRRARRRSAYDIAIGRLSRLSTSPGSEPGEVDAFFVELSAIVRWYLETRFELRAPELTTEEFLETMSGSPDLSSDHQTLLRDFLRRADLVKFAHLMLSSEDIDQSVATASRFLEETRQDAPMLEHQESATALATPNAF